MSKCGKGCMPECEYFTTGGCILPFNCPYKVEEVYLNSATSTPAYYAGTSYTEAQPDESESGIRKWYRESVGHEPANYDAAALKAYITHLEEENKELKHRAEVAERALKNACEDVKETVSFLIELSERVDGLRVEGYLPEESEPKAYINRAEKELAEEKKDEQS